MPAATIPTEIWELIFRSATSIPAPMIPPLENFYYHYFAADLGERRARRALVSTVRAHDPQCYHLQKLVYM